MHSLTTHREPKQLKNKIQRGRGKREINLSLRTKTTTTEEEKKKIINPQITKLSAKE